MKKLFILLAVVATLAACSTQKTELTGDWQIVQVGETLVPDSIETLLTFNDSLQLYSAYVGCNRINGTYLNTDSLVLTDGLSTKMYCEGLMELEHALCLTLPQVKQAKLLEDTMSVALLDAAGNTLLIISKQ